MKSRCFIALPFDTLKYRVIAFASSAKRPNVSFESEAEVIWSGFAETHLRGLLGGDGLRLDQRILLFDREPRTALPGAG
jgi:hypothetical protein